MKSITRKSDLRLIIQNVLIVYTEQGKEVSIQYLTSHLLNHKIKFPLLEFIGEEFFLQTPKEDHLEFCDLIFSENTMGGLVLIGKILQLRLEFDWENSINKARYYISLSDEWYSCDIIGERVFGFGMRYYTHQCFKEIKSIFTSNNRWVLRGMGAGCHFAIKRGLPVEFVEQLFVELLKYGKSKDKEIRQGIGWACKTTAKFHPELIRIYNERINNELKVDNWVRRKVNVGLERAEYLKQKNTKL